MLAISSDQRHKECRSKVYKCKTIMYIYGGGGGTGWYTVTRINPFKRLAALLLKKQFSVKDVP